MRRWLVIIEDPKSEFASAEELKSILHGLLDGGLGDAGLKIVKPGGLVASYLLDELPPPRHKDAGVYR